MIKMITIKTILIYTSIFIFTNLLFIDTFYNNSAYTNTMFGYINFLKDSCYAAYTYISAYTTNLFSGIFETFFSFFKKTDTAYTQNADAYNAGYNSDTQPVTMELHTNIRNNCSLGDSVLLDISNSDVIRAGSFSSEEETLSKNINLIENNIANSSKLLEVPGSVNITFNTELPLPVADNLTLNGEFSEKVLKEEVELLTKNIIVSDTNANSIVMGNTSEKLEIELPMTDIFKHASSSLENSNPIGSNSSSSSFPEEKILIKNIQDNIPETIINITDSNLLLNVYTCNNSHISVSVFKNTIYDNYDIITKNFTNSKSLNKVMEFENEIHSIVNTGSVIKIKYTELRNIYTNISMCLTMLHDYFNYLDLADQNNGLLLERQEVIRHTKNHLLDYCIAQKNINSNNIIYTYINSIDNQTKAAKAFEQKFLLHNIFLNVFISKIDIKTLTDIFPDIARFIDNPAYIKTYNMFKENISKNIQSYVNYKNIINSTYYKLQVLNIDRNIDNLWASQIEGSDSIYTIFSITLNENHALNVNNATFFKKFLKTHEYLSLQEYNDFILELSNNNSLIKNSKQRYINVTNINLQVFDIFIINLSEYLYSDSKIPTNITSTKFEQYNALINNTLNMLYKNAKEEYNINFYLNPLYNKDCINANTNLYMDHNAQLVFLYKMFFAELTKNMAFYPECIQFFEIYHELCILDDLDKNLIDYKMHGLPANLL